MSRATAKIGETPYAVTITTGSHTLTADELPALGGQDAGPAPFDLLLASLGACTSITLKMYAVRKQWPLKGLQVALHYGREGDVGSIDRVLTLDGDLTPEQRDRLADIVERTPVTLAIKAGVAIRTTFR